AVDVSGSMNDNGKIVAARDGATAFVAALTDRDELGVLTFNERASWARPFAAIGSSRQQGTQTISALFADGGTPLYDAVDQAYTSLAQNPSPSRISALVVLSDGEDRDSKLKLNALLNRIRFDNEGRAIRVFTIGYGSDAKADVLQKIADVTQGRYYAGKPENIREVFKEISTFF